MPSYQWLLLILLAYLSGSIPFSFLAGKITRGIDLRRYGSGTVSGSMLYEHVSRWQIVPIGLLEIGKAAFPTYLALRLGFGETGAVAAGLAALVGHLWPVFLNFTGGRGISAILGVLVVLFPWGCVWLLSFLAVGYLLKDSAPLTLAGIASMPALFWRLDALRTMYWLIGFTLVIMLIKRLEANRRPLPEAEDERKRILWMRLIYDRDVMDHETWIQRKP